jgi:hypothetical protein
MAGYLGSKAVLLSTTAASVTGNATIGGDLTVGSNALFVDESTGDISFYEDTGTTPKFFWDASAESLGIGTSSPSAPLQVTQTPSDTVGDVGISLKDANNAIEFGLRLDNASKDLHLDGYYSGAWYNRMTIDRSSGNVGIGTTTPAAPIDALVNSAAYVGRFVQSNTANGDGVLVQIGSTASSDYALTVRSDGGNTPVLSAKADGNVGIGTFSPVSKLHIDESAAAGTGILLTNDNNTSGTYSDIKWQYSPSDPSYGSGIRFKQLDTTHGGQLEFFTDNTSGTYTQRMTITEDGNVGIGTIPSTDWRTAFNTTVLQVGQSGSLFNLDVSNSDRRCMMASNALLNASGNFQHILEGPLTVYSQQGGTHRWYTAASAGSGSTASANERMRILSNGVIMVGLQAQMNGGDQGLEFDGGNGSILVGKSSANPRTHISFVNPNGVVGSITTSNVSTSFNTSSDYRLKENVTDVTDGITRVKQLAPKRFNFIVNPDVTVDGFIAHEAQAVVPEAVTGTHNEVDDDGNAVMQGIDQSKLVPLLTAALQEAIAKIETLETEMTSVKARLDALEAE